MSKIKMVPILLLTSLVLASCGGATDNPAPLPLSTKTPSETLGGAVTGVSTPIAPEVSSAKLPNGSAVCFYEHTNYTGQSFCLPANTNSTWLGTLWNDKVSSIQMESGHEVDVFLDIDYGGRSVKFSADAPDLRNQNINDLVSSLKIRSLDTAEMRDNAAMAELLVRFDVRANTWTKGPTLDAIINTYQRTGDAKYRSLIDQSFDAGKGWRSGDNNKLYYDDMAWYANAWVRAYDVTGDRKFLSEAQAIFNDMTKAWDGSCGGGLWWNSDRNYKNAITNELFLLLASRLARRAPNGTGSGSYQDWALKQWNWFSRSGMVNAQHLVNDGLNANCTNNGAPTWSYNQGVILGGLVEMWRLTGQRSYLFEAEQIAEATVKKMVYPKSGVLRDVCDEWSGGCTGDALIFKGMFAQGLARLYNADRGNKPQYADFLKTSADSLWNNSRTHQNALGVKWAGPTGAPNQSSQAAGLLLLGEMALLKYGGEKAP
jgi:predicted alpha-1,6-mannanase (GH76 family)